jgi:hypothetical protein
LNVFARLCSSKPVQAAVHEAVAEISRALGVRISDPKSTKQKRLRAKDYENNGPVSISGSRNSTGPPTEKIELLSNEEAGHIASDDELDNIDSYEQRLASSSQDDFSDGQDIVELEKQLASEGIRGRSRNANSEDYDMRRDLSISDSDSQSRSESPEKSKAATTKKTSFIPSLTMGGYISGSGSDVEEVDIAPKKNRRGQRERQQIWEKKYGCNAKHLQQQQQQKRPRPRRKASPDYTLGDTGSAAQSKRKVGPKNDARGKDDSGPLHPSWEAAKKAKEAKQKPVEFQGKKITFD